jgi:hypothetical protein
MKAAELIAYLKVNGAQEAQQHLRRFSTAFDSAGNSAARAGAKMLSMVNPFQSLGASLAGASIVGGIGLIGYKAIEASAQIEQLTARFGALNGSMAAGQSKMAWLKDFAKTTAGEFADLAEAGSLIEAGGMNIERILPMVNNVASAFGATRENIMELASAFVRLPSGVIGESMEIFRRFGITAGDLAAQGIKFSLGGQLKSSVADVFEALQRISQDKFGKIAEAMKNTFAVKLSNFQDSWFQMLARIGDVMLPWAKAAVDTITTVFNYAAQDGGVIDKLLGGGKKSGGEDAQVGRLQDALFRGAAYLMTVIQYAPKVFKGVVDQFGAVFDHGAKSLHEVVANWTSGAFWWKLAEAFTNLGFLIMKPLAILVDKVMAFTGMHHNERTYAEQLEIDKATTAQAFKRYMTANTVAWDRQNPITTWNPVAGAAGVPGAEGMVPAAQKLYEDMIAFSKAPPPETSPSGEFMKAGSNVAGMLGQIATHTRKTAENTAPRDLRRYALGGGDLAQRGLTPVELSAYRRGHPLPQVTVQMSGHRSFEASLSDLIAQAVTKMKIQGAL